MRLLQAIKVLKSCLELSGYAEDRDGGNYLLKVGCGVVCNSCDLPMVVDSRNIVRPFYSFFVKSAIVKGFSAISCRSDTATVTTICKCPSSPWSNSHLTLADIDMNMGYFKNSWVQPRIPPTPRKKSNGRILAVDIA